MSRRTAWMPLLLIAAIASSALADAPEPYVKKAKWLDTLIASREARMASGAPMPLPKFNRGDFTLMFWMNVDKPGAILTKAAHNGQRGDILINIHDSRHYQDKTGQVKFVIHYTAHKNGTT
jgi:hypothetical protein